MIGEIKKHLPGDFLWNDRIHYFDTISSTNTYAKELAIQGASHGTAVIAGSQSEGRGRMGRSFHSPVGMGVYLSVILRPDCAAADLMHLTCAAAVAMCDAVETAAGFRPGIKWTNDLVYEGKKLGGILTELSLDANGQVQWAVVGTGINCCQREGDFPEDIHSIACSLTMAANKPTAPSAVAAAMLAQLEHMSRELRHSDAILDRYRADCITLGRDISVHRGDELRYGTALDIDREGALLVRFSDGQLQAVSSGEVSVRGMYGYT